MQTPSFASGRKLRYAVPPQRSLIKYLISAVCFSFLFSFSARLNKSHAQFPASPRPPISASQDFEYLWCETEDMRGFATQSNGEPVLNPSWLDLPRSKAPGWGMNGTGTSAEWTQGGESGWNSAAASADETVGKIYQDLEIPRAAQYQVWIRYADWANKTENFTVRLRPSGDGQVLPAAILLCPGMSLRISGLFTTSRLQIVPSIRSMPSLSISLCRSTKALA